MVDVLFVVLVLKKLRKITTFYDLKQLLQFVDSLRPSSKKLRDKTLWWVVLYFTAVYTVIHILFWKSIYPKWWYLLGKFVGFVFVGVSEEYVYRVGLFSLIYSYLLSRRGGDNINKLLRKKSVLIKAIVITNIIFTLYHLPGHIILNNVGTLTGYIIIFVIGTAFNLVLFITRKFWIVAVMHTIIDYAGTLIGPRVLHFGLLLDFLMGVLVYSVFTAFFVQYFVRKRRLKPHTGGEGVLK